MLTVASDLRVCTRDIEPQRVFLHGGIKGLSPIHRRGRNDILRQDNIAMLYLNIASSKYCKVPLWLKDTDFYSLKWGWKSNLGRNFIATYIELICYYTLFEITKFSKIPTKLDTSFKNFEKKKPAKFRKKMHKIFENTFEIYTFPKKEEW